MDDHSWTISDSGFSTRTNIWTGPATGNWHDLNNWSANEVPTRCDNVVISNSNLVNIFSGAMVNCRSIETKTASILNINSNAEVNVINPE